MTFFDLKSKIVEKKLTKPTIFPHFPSITAWPFSSVNVESLANILKDKSMKFRMGKQQTDLEVQWEGDCQFIQATLREYINWMNGDNQCGMFAPYDWKMFWAYADYMYVKDLFASVLDYDVYDEIKWSNLGFADEEGKDMAIWIGSKGAHTVCHYDTYGYNLVAQICGRKRWILFPPTDAESMYPTRIPYEESTVFSKVNILDPDLLSFPRFVNSHPHIVTLEPGDLLFVPTHWWHFVENLESSISVNAWFPSKCDSKQRINEAITRLLIDSTLCYQSTYQSSMISTNQLLDLNWINPTETKMNNREENLTFLKNALMDFNDGLSDKSLHTTANSTRSAIICCCSEQKEMPLSVKCSEVPQFCFSHASQFINSWKNVHENFRDAMLTFVEEPTTNKKRRTDPRDQSIESLTFKNLVEAVTKPKVIELIRNEIEKDLLGHNANP